MCGHSQQQQVKTQLIHSWHSERAASGKQLPSVVISRSRCWSVWHQVPYSNCLSLHVGRCLLAMEYRWNKTTRANTSRRPTPFVRRHATVLSRRGDIGVTVPPLRHAWVYRIITIPRRSLQPPQAESQRTTHRQRRPTNAQRAPRTRCGPHSPQSSVQSANSTS